MNLSNYVQINTNGASTSAFAGSTGNAIALSTTYGFPFAASTGSMYDLAGYDGAVCIAVVTNTTYAALQPLISSSSGGVLTSAQTSSGWALSGTTTFTGSGYSTTFQGLFYDLYRPVARWVNFYTSVPTTSGYPTAQVVVLYGDHKFPTALGAGTIGSTVFVSPATG